MAPDVDKIRDFMNKIEGFMINDLELAIGGGANFLAVLGLLDYTEILGGIVSGNLISPPSRWSKEDNFRTFLRYLDKAYHGSGKKPYQDLDARLKTGVYGKIRSGLVHHYLLNQVGEIRTKENPQDECGIGVGSDGSITIVVERYFRDFRAGLTQYKKELLGEQDPILLAAVQRIPMHHI